MKIAISVIRDVFEESTGFPVRVRRIFETLKEENDATLIMRANKRQELENVITVAPAKTKLWNLKLARILIKNRFDCIYCIQDLFGFLTFYVFSRIFNLILILEMSEILSESRKEGRGCLWLPYRFCRFLEKFVAKKADYIIVVSEYIFKYYIKFNRNIAIIPLFVDENLFKRDETRDEIKREFKLLGLIGPFNEKYNRFNLDFIYTNLNKFDDRIKFVVIGKCDYKIKNKKLIYTGYLDSIRNYANQLSALDAVLVQKAMDPGPYTKILESMSCALPVFTTHEGVVGLDYVKPGRDILVFEKSELISKINELIFNDELMRKIGINARIVIEKHYSKKVNKKRLINIIEDLNANR